MRRPILALLLMTLAAGCSFPGPLGYILFGPSLDMVADTAPTLTATSVPPTFTRVPPTWTTQPRPTSTKAAVAPTFTKAPPTQSAPKATKVPSTPRPTKVPAQPTAVKSGGGTIICKDGYVWPGTTRQGACHGHGGIAK